MLTASKQINQVLWTVWQEKSYHCFEPRSWAKRKLNAVESIYRWKTMHAMSMTLEHKRKVFSKTFMNPITCKIFKCNRLLRSRELLTIFWRERGSVEIGTFLCKHIFLKTASATNIWSQRDGMEKMNIFNSLIEKSG